MSISKNVNFKATVQGVSGVLKDFKKFEEGGNNIFKALKNEAKLFAIAFTGIMGAAITLVDKMVQKFAQWEKTAANTNRMLKLNDSEFRKFVARIENSVGGGGALAVLPDAMNQVTESLYDYISALGTTQDSEAIFRDIEAAAQAAAVSGSTLTSVMSGASRIARTAGLTHGDLARVLNTLTAAEQDAVGTLPELVEGVNRTIGPMRNLNTSVEETAAFMAQLSGTGIGGMRWAARALKMVGTRFERERELLKELGVEADNFIDMMRELSDIDLEPEVKERLFGGRYQAFFTMMLDRIPALDKTIQKVEQSAGLLNRQFNAFTYTTISEQTRATNELEMAQIKLGERMKRFGPMIENIKTQIQLNIAEMAEWAIKHPSYVAAIVMGLMAIRTAYLAIKAASVQGMALAVIEFAIGGVIALGDALFYTTQERLDDVRASKQALEAQRAEIDQTREEIKARIDQAEATGASTERLAELNEQYETATKNSEELTRAISAQTVAEAQLAAQLAAETAAEEAGTEKGEGILGRTLTLRQQAWKTEEDRLRIQEAMTDAQVKMVNAMGDEAELNDIARDFLREAYGFSEKELVLLEAQVDSREEIRALIDAAQAGIEASRVVEGERVQANKDIAYNLFEQSGLLETIEKLESGTHTITEDGLRLLGEKNKLLQQAIIERAREVIIARSLYASDLERAFIIRDTVQQVRDMITAMDQRIAGVTYTVGLEGEEGEEDEGYGAPGPTEEQKAEADAWNEYLKEKVDELNEYRNAEEERLMDEWQKVLEENIEKKAHFEKKELGDAIDLTSLRWQRGMELAADGFISLMEGGAGDFVKTLGKNILKNAIVMALLTAFDKGTFSFGGLLRGILPGFAEGALVNKPTLGVFGERGPEYLIPKSLMDMRLAEYGAAGAAVAAADVSGGSIVEPKFIINESQPHVTVAIAPEGLVKIFEKGRRARVIKQGQ